MKTVYRKDDMSPKNHLAITRQDDGDIIVSLWAQIDEDGCPSDCGKTVRRVAVEFCAVGSGGGRSPETRRALMQLMEAMWRDNETRAIPGQFPDPD